jgi:hypothetical protein
MINPFKKQKEEGTFVEHRLKSRREKRTAVVLLLAAVAVIGWLYVFFGSAIFVVNRIEISGLERLDRGEVEAAVDRIARNERRWPFREKNIFFINTDVIAFELKEAFFIENVTVDKLYPNILRLNIEERTSSLVLLMENKLYELDRHGVVTDEFTVEEQEAILARIQDPVSSFSRDAPILKVRNPAARPAVGSEFMTDSQTTALLDAFKVLGDLGFGCRNAVLDYATSTKLVLNMFEPYEVYFDILEPLEPQIEGYYVFMDVRDKNVPIYEYVDARVPGKIFFR